MALTIRVYGSVFSWPPMEELIELLEESDFEVTIETEDEVEEEWEELLVFESSIEGPIDVYRYSDRSDFEDEVLDLIGALSRQRESKDNRRVLEILENTVIAFSVELPEDIVEDDNALLMCSLISQALVQKCDGIYCVDGEGFFDETGDLVYEVASGE